MDRLKAAVVLMVGTAGLITLVVIEILRAASSAEPDFGAIPPADMLVVVITLSAVPVLLLLSVQHVAANWISLVIAVLLSLFHLMHILEHVMVADFALTLLILVTMFTPSAAGAWLVWRLTRSVSVAEENMGKT